MSRRVQHVSPVTEREAKHAGYRMVPDRFPPARGSMHPRKPREPFALRMMAARPASLPCPIAVRFPAEAFALLDGDTHAAKVRSIARLRPDMAAPVLAAVGEDPVTVTSNGRIKARARLQVSPRQFHHLFGSCVSQGRNAPSPA